ncbi:MAG: hypothetical protein HS115_08365 [Spirochaetales bacterium]|nr:hypothetical protein [Spirochaetales bacterium]
MSEILDLGLLVFVVFLVFLTAVLLFGALAARSRYVRAQAEIQEIWPVFATGSRRTTLLGCRYIFAESLERRQVSGQDEISLAYFTDDDESYIYREMETDLPVLMSRGAQVRSLELIEHLLLERRPRVAVLYQPARPHRNRLASQEQIDSLAQVRSTDVR